MPPEPVSSASTRWSVSGVFSLGAALGIGSLGRRGRPDVVTALALVMMLALGAAFLSQSTEYEPQIFSLLFGEILGVSSSQIVPVAVLGLVCVLAVGVLYRRLMLTSMVPEIAEARGLRPHRTEMAFLVVVACATTMTVPVVGALLIFSLMIGPPAAARCVTDRPGAALVGSVVIALVTVWASIACSFETNWPVGFFVGTLSAASYGLGRIYAAAAAGVPGRPAGDRTGVASEPRDVGHVGADGSLGRASISRALEAPAASPPPRRPTSSSGPPPTSAGSGSWSTAA